MFSEQTFLIFIRKRCSYGVLCCFGRRDRVCYLHLHSHYTFYMSHMSFFNMFFNGIRFYRQNHRSYQCRMICGKIFRSYSMFICFKPVVRAEHAWVLIDQTQAKARASMLIGFLAWLELLLESGPSGTKRVPHGRPV